MSRILITGTRGLLGATVKRTLAERGFSVLSLESDLRTDEVRKEIESSRVSCIVHAAAKTDVAACEQDPGGAKAVNADGTRRVVEGARRIGAKVIYISTASVFDGTRGNYREDEIPLPFNVYNVTKYEGERHVRAYEHGVVVRVNLVGIHPAGSRGKNFFEWLVDSLAGNKDMRLFSDVRINPLSNWTIARILTDMVSANIASGVYHLASSNVRSKAEIARSVAARFPAYAGSLIEVSVDDIEDGVMRPKEVWLNADYTNKVLGTTMPSIEDEIRYIFEQL